MLEGGQGVLKNSIDECRHTFCLYRSFVQAQAGERQDPHILLEQEGSHAPGRPEPSLIQRMLTAAELA